jgi:tetratricopeptide (TPR) repeat protein
MAEAHDPAKGPVDTTAGTGIQALKTPDTAIQAPVTPPSVPAAGVSLEKPRQSRLERIDWILAGLVLVLTFFLGSFTAFNADIWMHLASGKLLAAGQYQFGVDPFAYTTKDVYWANHSWLFDWVVYGIYSLAGGAGLIIAKALLLVGLALVLLRIRRPEQSRWLPIIFVGLAMLALSTRALLQPTCISFLFLGLTLYWLWKAGTEEGAVKRLWLLPPLFALWVNLDSWFILGPIVVFLYWLGALVDGWTGRPVSLKPAALGKVLAVGLVACLLNPHHFRAFVVPNELAYLIVNVTDLLPSWMVAGGKTVQQIRAVDPNTITWISPLAWLHLTHVGLGNNVAGWTYFVLLLCGLVSFALPLIRFPRMVSFSALLVWLIFAVLSMLQARLVPFFAVVAGPIAVLNFQSFFACLNGKGSARGPWMFAGRLATTLAGLVLLFLAWPGWLHGSVGDYHSQRRVDWKLDIDASLHQAAIRLNELHTQGKLRQGFAFSPDVACYCAFFAPDVKGTIDYRFALFAKVAKKFAKVRKAFWDEAKRAMSGQGFDPVFPEWRQFAAMYGSNHLILTKFDGTIPTQLLAKLLWLEQKNWPMLYEDGRTLIFGWTEGNPVDRGLVQQIPSLNEQAFGRVPADQLPSPEGITFPQADRGFYNNYLTGKSAIPQESIQAQFYHVFHHFWGQNWKPYYQSALRISFLHSPMALSLAAPATITVPGAVVALLIPPRARDFGPPAAPILMMRHARLGVAAADHNADAYMVLANACEVLWRYQENHWSLNSGLTAPLRTSLRKVQTIAALKTSLNLYPENAQVHKALGDIYLEMQYLDVALDHYSLMLRYLPSLRPKGANREVREAYEAYKKNLEAKTRKLADAVKQRRDDYDLRSAMVRDPLEKYDMALRRGLAKNALTELKRARLEEMNPVQQFHLRNSLMAMHLNLGEVQEVGEALPLNKNVAHFQLLWAAAVGNYAAADQALEEQIKVMELKKSLPLLAGSYLQILAPTYSYPGLFCKMMFYESRSIALIRLRQGAELHLVRGLLALEKGDVDKAEDYFQKTLDLMGSTVAFPDRPIAQRYLELIRKK